MTTEDRGDAGLRSLVLRGIAWKAGSQVYLQVSRLVVALLLARLLSPHDYGLAAMVLVFSSFVILISDSALGTALIQRRDLSEADRSTVFWTGTGIGAACTVAGVALAGPLADFYGEPDVEPLFAALSIGFLVTALGTTQAALLARELDFRSLELRQIAASTVGAAVGITLAVLGLGAWALVGQQLVIGAVSTILLWRFVSWRPLLTFSGRSFRKLGAFGGKLFVQNLLYVLGKNTGTVLIGRFVGAAALGVYAISTSVILAPFQQIAGPVQQVLFPAFSRMQDDRERLADAWIRVSRLVGAISVPALVGLVVVAPDFVEVVLGDSWRDAVPVIQILAWAGLIQSLQTLNGEVLLALDRVGVLLWFTALWLAATVSAVAVGVSWGIVGVAACYAVANVLVEPLNAYLTARALRTSVWRFVFAFAGIAQAAALMALAVLGVRELLVAGGLPPALRLAVCILVGIVVYVPCCLWREPAVAAELKPVLARRRSTAATPLELPSDVRASEPWSDPSI
jgi:O-antigen/teichoic acid export membrane protein